MKSKNKKNFLIACSLLIMAIVGSVLLVKNDVTLMDTLKAITELRNNEGILHSAEDEILTSNEINYVTETNYRGSNLIPELYEFQFKKTDMYISNKDLQIADSKRNKLQKIAKGYAELNYNLGYRSLLTNPETFVKRFKEENISSVIIANDENELSTDEYANKIVEWLVDTHTVIESTFTTEDSLIYQDQYTYYIRGQLSSKVYATDDEKQVADYLEMKDVKIGKEYKQVLEIGIIEDMEGTYRIKSCKILKI